MKKSIYVIAFVFALFFSAGASPTLAPAASEGGYADTHVDYSLLLNSYTALAEERIAGIMRELNLMAATKEVKSGDWKEMKGLLAEFRGSGIDAAAVWFARPDGSYYTVKKGLTGQNLSDRPYFPGLMAGHSVEGELVISKSTGARAAVFAVPVKGKGKVVGAVGTSLSVESLSKAIEHGMGLPGNMTFYALDKKGQVSLHRKSDLLFVFPSDLGSPTLDEAIKQMYSSPEGVVEYEFQGHKTVYYKRSPRTGWVFALGVVRNAPENGSREGNGAK